MLDKKKFNPEVLNAVATEGSQIDIRTDSSTKLLKETKLILKAQTNESLEKRIKDLEILERELEKTLSTILANINELKSVYIPTSKTIDPRIDKMWAWINSFHSAFTNTNNYIMNNTQEQELGKLLK